VLATVQVSKYPHLEVIPSDLSARNADILLHDEKKSKKIIGNLLAELGSYYDLVIIDSPPGISLLHDNIFHAANWIFMPNIPTTLSIRSFETVENYFKENEFDLGKIKCFFNMVDSRKKVHQETMSFFYQNQLFCSNYIPYLSDIEKMGINEAPLETFAPSSYAAQCYRDLWKEMKTNCIV
jgi:cellulose biosynthesis protein BcsQ